jgi:hypothetical protein
MNADSFLEQDVASLNWIATMEIDEYGVLDISFISIIDQKRLSYSELCRLMKPIISDYFHYSEDNPQLHTKAYILSGDGTVDDKMEIALCSGSLDGAGYIKIPQCRIAEFREGMLHKCCIMRHAETFSSPSEAMLFFTVLGKTLYDYLYDPLVPMVSPTSSNKYFSMFPKACEKEQPSSPSAPKHEY